MFIFEWLKKFIEKMKEKKNVEIKDNNKNNKKISPKSGATL